MEALFVLKHQFVFVKIVSIENHLRAGDTVVVVVGALLKDKNKCFSISNSEDEHTTIDRK